jgi:PAS domain S-box-containing protein
MTGLHPLTDDLVGAALMRDGPDAIVACDRDGMIRTWNAGAERIFGFSRAEALGQSLDIVIPERLRARHWQGYHEMIRTGQSRYGSGDTLSVPAQRKDGSRVSIEFTLLAVKEAGTVIGLVAVMRDVTARFEEMKRLRQQLSGTTRTLDRGPAPV